MHLFQLMAAMSGTLPWTAYQYGPFLTGEL
jgi:hypothetical protein